MKEYRRDVPLSRESDYWFVEMGSIPDMPDWHMKLYAQQAYPFPRLEAAQLFAANHRQMYLGRDISIRYPDGEREVI